MKTVIEMAREAGFTDHNGFCEVIVRHSNGSWIGVKDELERFAALVAADEREQGQKWFDAVTAQHKQAILAEREACARIAEEPSATTYECTVACGGPEQAFQQRMPKDAHEIAKQIRARRQA